MMEAGNSNMPASCRLRLHTPVRAGYPYTPANEVAGSTTWQNPYGVLVPEASPSVGQVFIIIIK